MQNPACVTVQEVLAVVIVKVSALKRSCLDYMSFAQGILDYIYYDLVKALWLYSYNVISITGIYIA